MQLMTAKAVPLLLAVAILRVCLALFHVVPGVGYYELCFSAIMVLITYVVFLMTSCFRNPSMYVLALSALLYIISTTLRAIFPVRQELKACFHTEGVISPWWERLIALFGELAIGIQLAFVTATVAHLSGSPYAKVIFWAILGTIFVAEIVCYAACLYHPSLHNLEYLLWFLVVIGILFVASLAWQRKRPAGLRRLSASVIIVCLIVCYFFGFHLEYYSSSMQANNNMFACNTASPELWTDYFSNYAYPYFVVFAGISAYLTIHVQQIRMFDKNATSWLLFR